MPSAAVRKMHATCDSTSGGRWPVQSGGCHTPVMLCACLGGPRGGSFGLEGQRHAACTSPMLEEMR
eukprot:scaffold1996_cov132-Isochrysis_galbana.AAC.12